MRPSTRAFARFLLLVAPAIGCKSPREGTELGDEQEVQATPAGQDDTSGTRLKRMWLSSSDTAGFYWTSTLWDMHAQRPCSLPGGLGDLQRRARRSQGLAGDAPIVPYCVDPIHTSFDVPGYFDKDCSTHSVKPFFDSIVAPSGCDFSVFEPISNYPGGSGMELYRRTADGRCEPAGHGDTYRPVRLAPNRFPRLYFDPAEGSGRLRPWRVTSDDGLRMTVLAPWVYDAFAGTGCWLGGRDGDEETDECRVAGVSPVVDRTCRNVIGALASTESCAGAPLATRPARVATQVVDCHQRIFPLHGTTLPSNGGLFEPNDTGCAPHTGKPGVHVVGVGAPFRPATFRKVVSPSGGRLHPVMSVGDDGAVLAVDHYWDELQNMHCSLHWAQAEGKKEVTCVPKAVETRIVFRSSCGGATGGTTVAALILPPSCGPLPTRVFAQLPWSRAGTATEVEVTPNPEGDFYEMTDRGCERIFPVLAGKAIRIVTSVTLTAELR